MADRGQKVPSKVCSRKDQQRIQQIHRMKLYTIRSHIDTNQPNSQGMFHLQRNLKKEQVEGERQAEITKHNQLLVDRMTEIMNQGAPKEYGSAYPDFIACRSQAYRDQKLREIQEENLAILSRIETTKAHYPNELLSKAWESTSTYLKNVAQQPPISKSASGRIIVMQDFAQPESPADRLLLQYMNEVSSIKRAGTLPHLRGSQKRLEQAVLELENEEAVGSLGTEMRTLTSKAGSVSARDLVHPSMKLEPLRVSDTGSYSASQAGSTMPPPQARSKGRGKGSRGKRKGRVVSNSRSARASLGTADPRPLPPGPDQASRRSAPNRARRLVAPEDTGASVSWKQTRLSSSGKSTKALTAKQLLFQNGMKIDGFFVTMSVYRVATGLELVVYEPNSAETYQLSVSGASVEQIYPGYFILSGKDEIREAVKKIVDRARLREVKEGSSNGATTTKLELVLDYPSESAATAAVKPENGAKSGRRQGAGKKRESTLTAELPQQSISDSSRQQQELVAEVDRTGASVVVVSSRAQRAEAAVALSSSSFEHSAEKAAETDVEGVVGKEGGAHAVTSSDASELVHQRYPTPEVAPPDTSVETQQSTLPVDLEPSESTPAVTSETAANHFRGMMTAGIDSGTQIARRGVRMPVSKEGVRTGSSDCLVDVRYQKSEDGGQSVVFLVFDVIAQARSALVVPVADILSHLDMLAVPVEGQGMGLRQIPVLLKLDNDQLMLDKEWWRRA